MKRAENTCNVWVYRHFSFKTMKIISLIIVGTGLKLTWPTEKKFYHMNFYFLIRGQQFLKPQHMQDYITKRLNSYLLHRIIDNFPRI